MASNQAYDRDPEKAAGVAPPADPKSPEVTADEAETDDAATSYTRGEERALLWRQDLTIIPLSAFIYLLCYLDRSNIGNARILNASTGNDMQTEIGATHYQFNIALMIFLVAYALFEVPSNMLLKKLRPSRWLAFLMVAWGSVTMGLGGVTSFAGAAGVRFLLGVFEAGLFPGLMYYLTFWYRGDERSVRIAFILASATLAGAFGGAIAYAVGSGMNGLAGLSAWRWLFIVEGAPSCVSALLVWFFLPDYPDEALKNPRQREVAAARLAVEGSHRSHRTMTWADAKATLLDARLYVHYAILFCTCVPFSSLSLFAPSIVSGLGFKDLNAQLLTVPPYVAGYVVQVLVSYSADRHNARALHSSATALLGVVGFVASALLPPDAYHARYGTLVIAAAGSFGCIPPVLGWLTCSVHTTASVGLTIALGISLGSTMGQIPGVWIYKAEERDRGYPTGHWVNAAMLLVAMACMIGLRVMYGRWNEKLMREGGGRNVRLYKL
ncbi:hypothetical protein VTJ83DRAFT_3107 [Remersonia thermophila]|uniref:Major facilitator superfamily (MFS) profile domain-containing protein n=1 Tax=Remersonia thermophila TaxID=72144 RepID=A0ABR4DD46_9PEZI